jgi:hypothetical protein
VTKVAILQSCYIPWKGYFDIIGSVDIFVVYDDVQYSKNHWHNRNLVKTQHGPKWLSIPISKAAGGFVNIEDIQISQPFAAKHAQTISQAYSRAPYFKSEWPRLEALYGSADAMVSLSAINLLFLKDISDRLGFTTRFISSADLDAPGSKTDRLLAICQRLNATHYLSGPSAQSYLDNDKMAQAGISVEWMNYSGYPVYPQLHGAFEPAVSIIDLLFNVGPEVRDYMKSPRH